MIPVIDVVDATGRILRIDGNGPFVLRHAVPDVEFPYDWMLEHGSLRFGLKVVGFEPHIEIDRFIVREGAT